MRRKQPPAPECDACIGNQQLLQALRQDVLRLRKLIEHSPTRTLGAMRIDIADLRPGDVLVLSTEQRLTLDEFDEIGKNLAQRFPGVEKILLEGGMHMRVIRPEPPSRPADQAT